MADDQDDPEKEKQWQESLERARIVTPPLDPGKLLQPIRQIQQIQERQAETGRVFTLKTPAKPRQAGQDRGAELLKPFSGPGSTPSRKRFWNKVHGAVLSTRKLAGRHVTVDEHPGKSSVINVAETSARRAGPPGPSPAVPCDLDVNMWHRFKSVTQNKIGFKNITNDCAGGFGTGLRYTSVSYSCSTCGRTLGTGDAVLRYYLSANGGLSECVAAHLVLGGGCFGHHTNGGPGDCGCGGTGTISYNLTASSAGTTTIDSSIGNGLASVSGCGGSISHGTTTYHCADFDVNGLFESSLSDCGCNITLATEYTTDQLITDATAAIEPIDYTGGAISGPFTSLRNLITDEHQVLLTRAQYWFEFDPAPSDCVLSWRERTYDASDNCISDKRKSTTVHAGDTATDFFELTEPTGFNGTKEIVGDCCCDGVCAVLSQHDCFALACTTYKWLQPCGSVCATGDCV